MIKLIIKYAQFKNINKKIKIYIYMILRNKKYIVKIVKLSKYMLNI